MSADDWRPSAGWEIIRRRAALLAQVRAFFDRHQLVEVETPLLSADTVVDRHLDPLTCLLPDDSRTPERGRRMFLQTSPEFGMKRLLAGAVGDAPRGIYQITRAFRSGEQGPRHNPEFTLVEWYRRGDDYAGARRLLAALATELFGRPTASLSYRDAFRQLAGVDPLTADGATLAQAARTLQLSPPDSLSLVDRDGWLDLILTGTVEPQLGRDQPAILFDYPASQAALAQLRHDEDGNDVAERFELYYQGVELANGYHELLCAETLRARTQQNNQARLADGKPALPEENHLLTAMQAGLPVCCGAALGLDRVLMLLTGAKHIDEVLSLPIARA